jgi:hypothetical protein
MYHGGYGESTPNIWNSPTTFLAYTNIYSDGKRWLIGTCSLPKTNNPCVHFKDKTLNQEVSTIPADVFNTATNAISPYLP